MRIKADYVIKNIGEDVIVVPIKDEAIRFNGIISLNKTGEFLFKALQNQSLSEEALVNLLVGHYEVDKALAKKDCIAFIEKCKNHGLIDEESL